MAVRRLAEKKQQPADFALTPENLEWARAQIAKYPEGRQASAVIPILWRAQEQAGGWVPEAAIRHVGELLDMPYIRVLEVVTFYTMFNLEPIGRFHVQLCGTTPCMLRGSEELKRVCHARIGDQHHVTSDGNFSWVEVECLGACVNAPMVQINYDFYEDLTPASLNRVLDDLATGKTVKPGPQVERQLSAPIGGLTTLTDPALYAKAANDDTPGEGTHTHSGPSTSDDKAKRPGASANQREAPAPKPPAGDATSDKPPGGRQE
jgi:NADH-quinone oxidoreductase subunit E